VPAGPGNVESFDVGDWIYFKGELAQSQGGFTYYKIYRVKKAGVTTKDREPATGDYYYLNPSVYWIVNETLGTCYPVWFNKVHSQTAGDVDFVDIDGWRYHKGGNTTVIGSIKRSGVWREEL